MPTNQDPSRQLLRLVRLEIILSELAERIKSQNIPESKLFDMAHWGEATTDSVHTCNTAHCVIGWAMTDPWFYAEGLIPNSFGAPSFINLGSFDEVGYYNPKKRLELFFGLERSEALKLFFHYEASLAQQLEYLRERIALKKEALNVAKEG